MLNVKPDGKPSYPLPPPKTTTKPGAFGVWHVQLPQLLAPELLTLSTHL